MDAVRLMKELKANHEQEGLYLPKETGLKLIESAVEVRLNRALVALPLPQVLLCAGGPQNWFCVWFPGRQPDFGEGQRRQGGGPVESDQLLQLQHADLRPGCEPAGQIPGHDQSKRPP